MSKCVFAGTFDPFTKGHLDVVNRLAKTFDTVYVVVSKNASKNTFACGQERYEMVKDCVSFDNVQVVLYEGLLVDFCNQKGVDCIVKGVRNAVDFDYERFSGKNTPSCWIACWQCRWIPSATPPCCGIRTTTCYVIASCGATNAVPKRQVGYPMAPFLG